MFSLLPLVDLHPPAILSYRASLLRGGGNKPGVAFFAEAGLTITLIRPLAKTLYQKVGTFS